MGALRIRKKKEMVKEIKTKLEELSEEKYREFNKKLLPGVEHVLGVRVPVLRSIAKEIARKDFHLYLREIQTQVDATSYHEEIMLQGLVLCSVKMEREERAAYLDQFVPKISNWAICDTCTMGMKFMQKDPDYWYSYIMKYEKSKEEFELRFLLVALLAHYMDKEHVNAILEICNTIHHEGYYVKMAVAWLVSICYIQFPEQTGDFLKDNGMDDFTHNKSIQKIRESQRVNKKEKEALNRLKRS